MSRLFSILLKQEHALSTKSIFLHFLLNSFLYLIRLVQLLTQTHISLYLSHWNIWSVSTNTCNLANSEGIYMSHHFSYSCKIRCPLNLVLEKWEYLWFYWTFWIVNLDCGLKLHKLSIHTLVMLQKWLEIYIIIVWNSHCIAFPAIFATEKFQKKFQHGH